MESIPIKRLHSKAAGVSQDADALKNVLASLYVASAPSGSPWERCT